MKLPAATPRTGADKQLSFTIKCEWAEGQPCGDDPKLPHSQADPMLTSNRILVVEDEADLSDIIAFNLQRAGYTPLQANDGVRGLDLARRERPDLVILDLMLPRLDGLDVARRLRAEPTTASIPLIMLTARAEERDQLTGLAIGADDYITKPFSIPVLMARIDAVLRRTAPVSSVSVKAVGPIRIDLDSHEVSVEGELINLTTTEFKLLAALVQAEGRVLTRQELISRAIGAGIRVTDRAIDVHLAAVRKKLGEFGGLIRTVRGVGYRISPEREPV